MANRAVCVALLLSSLPIAGCGTVANLARPGSEQGGKLPFGGVRHDVASLKIDANGECGCRPRSESEHYRQLARRLFWAADLPFTAVADVVTWPYAATYTYINQPVPTPPVMQPPPGTLATVEDRPKTAP